MHIKNLFNKVVLSFLAILLGVLTLNAQTPLYTGVLVSDVGTSNNIGQANTSRNIAVDAVGNIGVVYVGSAGLRFAKSVNRGQSFLPSVQLLSTATSGNCEVEVADNGNIYVIYSNGSQLQLFISLDGGATFTGPNNLGTGSTPHIASYGSNVYVVPQNGSVVYRNSNNGVGAFSSVSLGSSWVYADIRVDKANGDVYMIADNPTLYMFRSTNSGATFSPVTISGSVFYSSYAITTGPLGKFIYAAGGSNANGYRIDFATGSSTLLTVGTSAVAQGRTLLADEFGNFVDGYAPTTSSVAIRVSGDRGTTFGAPITIANATTHNIVRNASTQDVDIVYQGTDGKIYLAAYPNLLKGLTVSNVNAFYCAGATGTLNYSATGALLNSGNQFIVQLSDKNRSFANPTTIGSISSTNATGTINFTIPDTVSSGTQYRIRVISTNTAVTGADNLFDISINPTPVANITTSGATSICEGSPVLLASSAGNSYLWSNGATTSSISVNVPGTYTVTVGNGCGLTATSAPITVNVTPKPVINVTGSLTLCGTGASVGLSSSTTGTAYLWSNGATTQSITATTAGTYTVRVTGGGCTLTSSPVTVVVNTLPTVSVAKTDETCVGASNGTITINATGTATPFQYSINGGNSFVSNNSFTNLSPGTYTVIVKTAGGCTTTGQQVTIGVTPDVTAPVPTVATLPVINRRCAVTVTTIPTATDNCSGVVNATTESNLNFTTDGTYTIIWKYKDAAGNETTQTQTVIVSSPKIGVSGAANNIPNGNTATIVADNTDFGTMQPSVSISKSFTIQNTGTQPLTITAVNSSNNAFTVSALSLPLVIPAGANESFSIGFNSATVGVQQATITINSDDCNDTSYTYAVKATVVCIDPTFLNTNINIQNATTANSCDAVVNYPLSVTGAPAPNVSYTFSGATIGAGVGTGSGQTFNKGITHVVVTATNICTTTTTEFDVVVVDSTLPIATSQNITVQLGANGTASITAAQVNNGSSDNCGIASIAVDKTSFDCSNVGANTVTLTVTDVNGNSSTATAVVTVVDNILPIATSQNITVQLGANGTASITAAQVNNGSTDNCGIASISVNKTTFDCSNVGANTVTLTVTDVNGNSNTATAVVTVVDNIQPIATSQNITVQLGANGTASITAAQVNNGSTDNCGIASISVNKTSFDCSNVGANTVTLTVTDVNGNSSTATATVTVVDNIAPTITAPANITVNTNLNCTATGVVLGTPVSADNCTVQSVTNNAPAAFPIGNTTVTWIVTDASGRTAAATQVVTVKDATAPTPQLATLPDITGQCSVTVSTVPKANDNCSGIINATTTSPLVYSAQGTYTITWRYTDAAGNISTQTQKVIVKDDTPPVINCPAPITVTAPANQCGATVTYSTPTVSDNCGGGNTGVQTLTSGAQFFDYADNRMETQNSPGLPMTFVPTDGQKLAVFLVNCGSTHYMYQNVTLPSSGPINLGLDMKYTNHFTGGFSTSQFIAIELRNPSTNAIIATLFKTNPGAAQSTPMTHYNFDLSAYAGQQVRLQVVDAVINNFFIDVQLDNITIPGSSLVNGSFETGDYTGWTIGSASTSCGTFGIGSGPSLSVVQKEGLPSGSVFPIGTTTNTFEVTDLAGNKTTCSFNVTVNAPEISISGNGTEIVSGDNTPSTTDHTDLGGTIPGTAISKTYVIANNGTSALIINSINSNNAAFTRSGISLPATIQPGQTASFTISFNATALGTQTAVISVGNTDCNEANYSFAVKAEVTCTNPVFINLNPQVQANTTASSCVAIVNYPLAITGIPAPGLSYTFSGATTGSGSGTGTGNTFNKGTTHVIVTAVNPCSTVLYEFDVIVSDITAPIAIAQNITVNLNANGAATITAAQINNGSSDNCGIASIALDKTSFDCSNVGANTVTLTVTDVNGNSSTATALVTVVDNINPTITAPANIAQGTDAGVCGATVNLGTPVTADNCSIATVSNNAPTLFPVGTTIV
ncbi:HYR domain-containing protein, partial [Sediminibacterium goheungense]